MLKKNPKISVVMPAYNSEEFIAQAIESILSQTFADFELIIVNDCSTDNTLKIAQKYQKEDSRVKIISNKINMQIGASLNLGIALASGEFIARMDADDISLPNRFEEQYKLINSNDKLAVIGCNMITMNKSGQELGRRTYDTNSKTLKKRLFRYSPFAHPSTMFKKNIFHELGGYNPVFSPTEDLDLWMRVGMKYEFSNVDKYLFKYRVYGESTSNRKLRRLELKVLFIRLNAFLFYGYKPTIIDLFYNIAQLFTAFLMPSKARYTLFNFLRNKKII